MTLPYNTCSELLDKLQFTALTAKTAPDIPQCHLVSDIAPRTSPRKNECIPQRMHFFRKKGMTSERIRKSAKKAVQKEKIMLLYRGS